MDEGFQNDFAINSAAQAPPRAVETRQLEGLRSTYLEVQADQIREATGLALVPLRLEFPLSDAPMGRYVYLVAQRLGGLLGRRLVDLGFTLGAPMRLVRKGPAGSLIAVSIRSTVIALRSSEAKSIIVSPSSG